MKKLISIVVIIVLFFNFIFAYGNSGPVIMPSYPSSEMVTVEENSPIEVINENLTFDFSNVETIYDTENSNVTAEYEMYNSANETKTVKMAFPIIKSIGNFSEKDIIIKENDNVLPFEIYIGDKVKSHRDISEEEQVNIYDFNKIVSSINIEKYQPKNFSENEIGKLYKIHAKPKLEGVNLAVDFNFDSKYTKVMIKGFNRFERDDSKIRIASGFYKESEVLEIFALGKDLDLKINLYKDGSLTEKTDLLDYEITTEDIDVKTYLPDYVGNEEELNYKFNDVQLYNIYTKALDDVLLYNLGFCSEDMLTQEEYSNRIITLLYTVEFPENSTKNVSVSYVASGTMDRRETPNNPQYTYDYILNPAKNWRNFKNLSIKIITPEVAPYIIKSTIELKNEENNIYSATLSSLPDKDLSFTLYEKEKISILDRINYNSLYILGYLIMIFVIIIIVVVIVYKIITKIIAKLRSS